MVRCYHVAFKEDLITFPPNHTASHPDRLLALLVSQAASNELMPAKIVTSHTAIPYISHGICADVSVRKRIIQTWRQCARLWLQRDSKCKDARCTV